MLIKKIHVGSLLLITDGYITDNNKQSKAKVLAIDEIDGQKVYGLKIDPVGEPTYTTSADGKKINISSIGHLPISESTLKKWSFTIIGEEPVQENELEGYKYWKEAPGGMF